MQVKEVGNCFGDNKIDCLVDPSEFGRQHLEFGLDLGKLKLQVPDPSQSSIRGSGESVDLGSVGVESISRSEQLPLGEEPVCVGALRRHPVQRKLAPPEQMFE